MTELRQRGTLANKATDLDTETELEWSWKSRQWFCMYRRLLYKFVFNFNCCFVLQNFDLDSDEDKSLQMKKKLDLSFTIPTGTDKAPEILDATLSHLPPKSVASFYSFLYIYIPGTRSWEFVFIETIVSFLYIGYH